MTTTAPTALEETACHDCGRVQRLRVLGRREVARCVRCDAELRSGGHRDTTPLALAIAGFVFGILANVEPVLTVRLGMSRRSNLLVTGPRALVQTEHSLLALLVTAFSIVIPLLWLALVAWVTWHVARGTRARELGPAFRIAERLRPWAMTEVYVLGAFVAYTRLWDLGPVTVGAGGAAIAAMAFFTFLVDRTLDRRHVWDAIRPQITVPERGIACPHCDLLTAREEGKRCPRCRGVLRLRKANSLQRTTALVLAGAVLYVPANALPIMAVGRLGRPTPDTIVSGIIELARRGLWPLALIVLFASILVPVLKLVSLTWFILSVRWRSRYALVFRTRLYRWVDAVGRWSNIDVFMISILVALVRFGVLATVEAQAGALAFAAVVVVTMLAAEAFDPRLMWDAAGEAA